ncbi:MAG: hypothetical protein KDK99_10035 [Verrucomicrobiales bacterium]|nr:hypothetical protein [Verrucomicrobiales bacterium]
MKLPLQLSLLLLTSTSWLVAQESSPPAADPAAASAPVADPDLPARFDPTTLSSLVQNPPFTRSVNPSDSLVLTGVAYIEGKPVVTILDTETKQSFVVSEKPNAKGWTLEEAPASRDVNRISARVSMGGEVVTLRYDENALKASKKDGERRDSSRPSGGPPPPGDGRGGYDRSRGGPSREDVERFRSLSSEAQEKFRKVLSDNRERLMNATPEERSAYIRSTFERIENEDKKR